MWNFRKPEKQPFQKSKPQKLEDEAFLNLLNERHGEYVLRSACQSELTLLKAILVSVNPCCIEIHQYFFDFFIK